MATSHSAEHEFTHTLRGILSELEDMERKVLASFEAYDRAESSLRETENELERFLDYYYEEVGSFFQDMPEDSLISTALITAPATSATLNAGKESTESAPGNRDSLKQKSVLFQELAASPPVSERRTERTQDALKGLYRRLAKSCHPDCEEKVDSSRNYQEKNELFTKIHAAYQSGDLKKLRRLELECLLQHERGGSVIKRKRRLEECLDTLSLLTTEARTRRRSLVLSPAYRLKLRADTARQQGFDLITVIRREMQKKRVAMADN